TLKSSSNLTATRKSCCTWPRRWPPFIALSWSSPRSKKSSLRLWEVRPMPSLLPRNMLLIARREYLEQIRGRAFRLSTILVPVLILFLLGVSAVTGRKLAAHRHIAIAADNPALATDIRSDLNQEKGAGYTVDIVAPFTAQDRANLQARVANKSLDGLLVIENSSGGTPSVTYTSQSSSDLMSTSRLEDAIDHGFLDLRLAQQGVPADRIQSLAKP